MRIALDPAGEGGVGGQFTIGQRFVGRRSEMGGNAVVFGLGQRCRAVLQVHPFGFDLAGEFLDAKRLHQNLDARLVGVVAPAEAVVDAQDGFAVGEDVLPGQELADDLAADRRAPEAAADDDAETDLAVLFLQMQADVVEPGDGTVFAGAGNGDLELARQEGEFRVEGAPLAEDFGERARVDHLVGGDAGELVGGDVADAVAGGLDGVHLDFGEVGRGCPDTSSILGQLNCMLWRVVKWP